MNTAPADSNLKEFSVSEFSKAVKRNVEGAFPIIRIRGEVSDLSKAGSRHIYFSLKEGRDSLSAVMWKGTVFRMGNRLNAMLKDGAEIIVVGKISTYSGSSRYQIVVNDLELAGEGALLAQIEELRNRLQDEGIFNLQNEDAIPFMPEVIGVVTSPTGSVIRDILHRLKERFPRRVVVWPVAVQGDTCAPEVADAINGFNVLSPDGAIPKPELIIVARGGGSFADLNGFNDEGVVRATAGSAIPIISAIGHETDTTLIDYAANKRAPTPTAAAEFAVPVQGRLVEQLRNFKDRIVDNVHTSLVHRRQRVGDVSRGLPVAENLFAFRNQELDNQEFRLKKSLEANFEMHEARLKLCSTKLTSPKALNEARYRFDYLEKRITSRLLLRFVENDTRILDGLRRKLQERIKTHLASNEANLSQLKRLLDSLGYKQTLNRGYAVVRQNDQVMTRVKTLKPEQSIEIEMNDGEIRSSRHTIFHSGE